MAILEKLPLLYAAGAGMCFTLRSDSILHLFLPLIQQMASEDTEVIRSISIVILCHEWIVLTTVDIVIVLCECILQSCNNILLAFLKKKWTWNYLWQEPDSTLTLGSTIPWSVLRLHNSNYCNAIRHMFLYDCWSDSSRLDSFLMSGCQSWRFIGFYRSLL